MSVSTLGTAPLGPDVVPGTVPAWALVFFDEAAPDRATTVRSETYDGSVSATLVAGLTGGTFEIVIEGMTDADYAAVRPSAGTKLGARLHLWWENSPGGVVGDLARFTGFTRPFGAVTPDPPPFSLVAVIRVDRIHRRSGRRRVEVVVTGREAVQARLADGRVEGRCFTDLTAALTAIGGRTVPVRGIGLEPIRPPAADESPATAAHYATVDPGTALSAMTTQIEQVRLRLGLHGLSPALIRDGVLYVGDWTSSAGRGAPIADRTLDDAGGLVDVQRGAERERDPQAGPRPKGAPAARLTVAVTALGRPDLKPGDTLRLDLPPEDFPVVEPTGVGAALLTTLTGLIAGGVEPPADQRRCRVLEVAHKLSREQGFVTTVQAVVLDGDDDHGWDPVTGDPVPEADRPKDPGRSSSDHAQGAAHAVRSVARGVLAGLTAWTRPRVGVVHDHTPAEDPRLTSTVWYADTAPDGLPGAAQRTEVTEDRHGEAQQVPYLTPFAWGSYGLVLPRYPGTRVLLANAAGGPGDLVDIGGIWPRGGGPKAEPGDWWLALPIAIPDREHLTDPTYQEPGDGIATHDLIDGDGLRVVETLQLVLRGTEAPTEVPDRPKAGDHVPNVGVLIESTRTDGGSCRIVLDSDGSVVISASSITFDTGGQGDITLKAKNVKVQLDHGGTMDVS